MATNNNVTFRRKHRRVWYGVLCLVLITAAVSTVSLLPTQIDDAMSIDGEGDYTLTGGGYNKTSDKLGDLITEINKSTNKEFTITVNADDTIASDLTLNKNNKVTLISSSEDPFTLTILTAYERHFTVANGATLTLENIILDGGGIGGGIGVENDCTFVMNEGAVIQNCHASNYGGGLSNAGHFTMNEGAVIQDCYASNYGGGVYNYGTFTMDEGAVIQNCSVSGIGVNNSGGGGVYNSGGNFTMNDGAVIQDCYTSSRGGGVYNYYYGMFTMNKGAVIQGCTSIDGGGVFNSSGTFNMNKGAVIQNCSVLGGGTFEKRGGGVYNANGIINMNGGEITDNKASLGGGVYSFGEKAKFTMNGGEIGYNTALGEGGGVYNNSTFTMNGGEIGYNTAMGADGTYPGGGGVYTSGSDANFTLQGGKIFNNKAQAGKGGGVFYLSGQFKMSGGEISGNSAFNNGGGVYSRPSALFKMSGGEITDNTTNKDGGGVYIDIYNSFEMSGGEITNNKASSGGGVYSVKEFTMNGKAVISGNTASNNGGGVYNTSTFTMNGGEISDNKANKNGGGVYNTRSFTMNGEAVISNNNAAENGGGVYTHTNGYTFAASGNALISENLAKCGGGVFIEDGKLDMKENVVISKNTAGLGGGMYSNKGTIAIEGGEISDNTATDADPTKGSGGGIYTVDFAKLTVKPAVGMEVVFSGNKAPMLRMTDNVSHASTYEKNILGVVLDEWVSVIKNAPAYNNYDINYLGDAYVVFIEITLSGSGTVKVTDSTNGAEIPLINGRVNVPLSCEEITLSAVPEEGYGFVWFIIDGVPTNSDGLITLSISESKSVKAEFDHVYFITFAADDGSEISLNEGMKVLQGENVTFEFSAKPGYRIIAVYIDGEEISSEEMESGKYTFSDVKSNHEVRVESEAVGGSSGGETGTGPDNGTGTGPGTGTGTGPDNGTGTGPGGESVGSGPVSGKSVSGEWSVLGLICAVLAILTGMIAVVAGKGRFRTDNEEKRSKTGTILRVIALMIGIVSAAAFFLMEDWGLSAAAFGEWTLLMFVLFLAALILAMVSFRFDGAADEAGNGN